MAITIRNKRSARRKEAIRTVMVSRPTLTEEQKQEIGRRMDELYGEQGLPR